MINDGIWNVRYHRYYSSIIVIENTDALCYIQLTDDGVYTDSHTGNHILDTIDEIGG